MRQHPIENLTANELRRLIGQEVGLQWLLPLTFEALLETGRMEAAGGFCDDDLL
ncbi:contact-dependent growth inhibition system immunity protein [Streptomyces sp. LB8]|uniref:contact-dependent growth inhibition system immunity protein n=1 Tax=Streptomyces sp. LB8 TaxID=3042509 RepID=UPI003463D352